MDPCAGAAPAFIASRLFAALLVLFVDRFSGLSSCLYFPVCAVFARSFSRGFARARSVSVLSDFWFSGFWFVPLELSPAAAPRALLEAIASCAGFVLRVCLGRASGREASRPGDVSGSERTGPGGRPGLVPVRFWFLASFGHVSFPARATALAGKVARTRAGWGAGAFAPAAALPLWRLCGAF